MTSNAIDAGIGDLTIDAGSGVGSLAAGAQPLDLSGQTLAIAGARKEIVFIEDNVADIGTLLNGFGRDKEVVILDSKQDGLHQIAQALAGQTGVDALHIISHGEAGAVDLGSLILNAGNLDAHRDDLQTIRSSMSADGDIMLYGCKIGADDGAHNGAGFVQQLAIATGADVAASNDLTGSAAFGGNWNLEVTSGRIETASVVDAHTAALYQQVLSINPGTIEFGPPANFVSGLDPDAAAARSAATDVIYKVNNDINYQLKIDGANTAVTTYSDAASQVFAGVYAPETAVTFSFAGGKIFTPTAIALSNWSFNTTDTNLNILIKGYDTAGHQVGGPVAYNLTPDSSYVTRSISLANLGSTPIASLKITPASGAINYMMIDSISISSVSPPPPTVTTVSATTANGAYKAGDIIHITVAFDQAVTVNTSGGTPTLQLETGTTDHNAVYASGSGSSTLTFNYTVQAGDTSADLDYLSSAALSLNGATIKDSGATVNATLTLPSPGAAGSLGANKAIVIDTTAPAAPSAPDLDASTDSGSSSTDNITNSAAPVFHGSAEAGATVKLYDSDGTTVLGTTTASGGSWTITTALSEGAHTLSARATDAAGNTSAASSTLSVTVDTTAPTVAVTSDHATLASGQSAAITFTFSEDPGASFTAGDVSVSGGTLGALSGSGLTRSATFTPTANTNNGSASIGVISHSYTDVAGNNGAAGAPVAIGFDTQAPTLAITSSAAQLKIGETATITFTFSEDPGSSFSWDGSSGSIAVSGGTLSAISGSGLTRSAVFTPDAGVDGGSASITVAGGTYTDAAGNGGTAATTPSLHFDTLAPHAPSTPVLDAASDSGASNSDGVTNAATLGFSGTADAGSIVHLYDGATEIDHMTATGGTYTFTVAGLGEGSHAISAVAVDPAGNASAASGAATVLIDRTAPTTTVASATLSADTGSSSSDMVTSTAAQTISGTLGANLAAGEQVMVSLDNGAHWSAATTSVGANTWSLAATLSGSGTLTVQVLDQAGNAGAAYTHAYTLDTTAPSAPSTPDLDAASDSGSSSTDNITADTTPGFSGTAEANSTVHLYDGATDIGSASADGSGVWHITSSLLGAGSHTISATAVDAAGNVGAASSGLTIDVLTAAPTTTIASLALSNDSGSSSTDFITRVASQTLSGALSGALAAGERVQVSLDDGGSWNDATDAVGSSSWSYNATLAAGSHDIQVRLIDAVGNAGTVRTQAYTLDTQAPTLAITSSAAQLKIGETATITFTFSEDPGSSFNWDGSSGSIAVSGGTLSAISGSGLTRSAVFTPAAGVDAGTASITVANGAYTDAAGNGGAAAGTPSLSFDTLAPNAPSAPTLQAASDTGTRGDGITEDTHPVIEGTALANAQVTLYDTVGASHVQVGTATADASGHWSIASAGLGFGSHSLSVTQLDGAGNVSAASAAFALRIDAPPAPVDLIDGVAVDIQPVSLPDGTPGTAVSIPIVTSARVESSGAPGVADIPLATGQGGANLLLAQLATGYGLSASGAERPASSAGALLIAAIKAATPTHTADDQGHLTGNGQSFLDCLASTASLLVESVKPVGAPAAADGTLTLSAPVHAAGQGTALVIDAGGLGQGATIALQQVDFAAVIGAARVLVGGTGTVLSGDAASQHVTVAAGGSGAVFAGAGDDVLSVGAATAATAAGTTLLHGGLDNDVAVFGGAQSDYNLAVHNGYVVVSSKAAPDVAALVVNVEQLQFSDASVAVQDSADMDTLAGMYQTVLGRQADMKGIEYWADTHQAGASWGAIALAMIGSSEHAAGQAGFNGDAGHDVALLYSALFDRTPDAAGLAYWTDAISHGARLEQVATAFVQAAEMVGHHIVAPGWNFSV